MERAITSDVKPVKVHTTIGIIVKTPERHTVRERPVRGGVVSPRVLARQPERHVAAREGADACHGAEQIGDGAAVLEPLSVACERRIAVYGALICGRFIESDVAVY